VQITLPNREPTLAILTISTFTRNDGKEICYHRYISHRTPTEILGYTMEQLVQKLEQIELPSESEILNLDAVDVIEDTILVVSDPSMRYITLKDVSKNMTITVFPKRSL
jgi:hypothetical protein